MPTRAEHRQRTRAHIASVAAQLFARNGYDAVLVTEVARAADVSEQTVYNYFPAKQDLVLDQAAAVLDQFRHAVLDRGPTVNPAQAIQPLLVAEARWIGAHDDGSGQGVFLALAVSSPTFRRFALEFREQQTLVVAEALATTNPKLSAFVAHAHAAALVSLATSVADTVGRAITQRTTGDEATAVRQTLTEQIEQAVSRMDRAFDTLA